MLQQTQVATVLNRYYAPFLARFPTVEALAQAPLADILKAWEGLGYYTRARNLHKAAQMAAPALPDTIEGLLALPGIGKNTAHAIAAFAYRQPVPVMEANVKRILHRLEAKESMSDAQLWDMAAGLVNKDDPFTHNQAMMDIGAMICTPRAPLCGECPLAIACKGKTAPHHYPAPKQKKDVPVRQRQILLVMDKEGKLYLKPRDTAFLGGLSGFPQYEKTIRFEDRPIAPDRLIPLGTIEHSYSHFHLKAAVYLMHLTETKRGAYWHPQEDITSLPLSRADHKALALFTQWQERALSPSAIPRTPSDRKRRSQSKLPAVSE